MPHVLQLNPVYPLEKNDGSAFLMKLAAAQYIKQIHSQSRTESTKTISIFDDSEGILIWDNK